MLTKDYIVKVLKNIDKDEFGIKKIGLFGSYSKDEADSNSDIDVLVEFRSDVDTFEKTFDLQEYLRTVFNTKIDIVSEKALKVDKEYSTPRITAYKRKVKEEILRSVQYV